MQMEALIQCSVSTNVTEFLTVQTESETFVASMLNHHDLSCESSGHDTFFVNTCFAPDAGLQLLNVVLVNT